VIYSKALFRNLRSGNEEDHKDFDARSDWEYNLGSTEYEANAR
jgi:hypothetical protein